MGSLTLTILLIKKFEGVLIVGGGPFTLGGWVTSLLGLLLLVLPLLGAIAFYTLGERKCMAGIQRRRGPNITGFWGVLQPLADGLKLVLKEFFIPQRANPFLFTLAPQVTFVLSLLGWGVIPLAVLAAPAHLPLGVLFVAAISALAIYGIVLSGWASNSKYAFLGALRSVAQVISYELPLSFVLVGVALVGGSLALLPLVVGQSGLLFFFPLLPLVVVFFISVLAETNRAPFDLPEAEAEIVAGYNVEYSGILFALFFLGEYSNMILMGALLVCLFLGGWTPLLVWVGVGSFIVKLLIPLILFIVVRAILPRLRYDQLMELGWKDLLPLTLGYLIFLAGVTFAGDFPIAEIWGHFGGADLALLVGVIPFNGTKGIWDTGPLKRSEAARKRRRVELMACRGLVEAGLYADFGGELVPYWEDLGPVEQEIYTLSYRWDESIPPYRTISSSQVGGVAEPMGGKKYRSRARYGRDYLQAWEKADQQRLRHRAELMITWGLTEVGLYRYPNGKSKVGWGDLLPVEQDVYTLSHPGDELYPPYCGYSDCSSDDEGSDYPSDDEGSDYSGDDEGSDYLSGSEGSSDE